MGFGNDMLKQGELISESGMASGRAADATRLSADRVHRRPGTWPSAQTVVRLALVAFVAIVVIGWILSALNS
jgi:hypothetical protein